MPRCEVTVEGRTMEVEAKSLYMAAIEYNAAQVCGRYREYPKLQMETVISVLVEGETESRIITWRQVMDWANRVAEEKARRWFAEKAEKEQRGKPGTQKAARLP